LKEKCAKRVDLLLTETREVRIDILLVVIVVDRAVETLDGFAALQTDVRGARFDLLAHARVPIAVSTRTTHP